jgi:hypothetical protein
MTNNSLNIGVTAGGSNVYNFPALTTCTLATSNKVQIDQTGSRALNTNYTNSSTASSLMVMATVRCAISLAAGNAYVFGLSDGSSPCTTTASGLVGIQAGLLNEDNTFQLTFVVGTNTNYRINSVTTNGTCTLGKFFEMSF